MLYGGSIIHAQCCGTCGCRHLYTIYIYIYIILCRPHHFNYIFLYIYLNYYYCFESLVYAISHLKNIGNPIRLSPSKLCNNTKATAVAYLPYFVRFLQQRVKVYKYNNYYCRCSIPL
jgi:hypothetical protein